MLPLYQYAEEAIQSSKTDHKNAGLWYDKFCNLWKNNFDSLDERGKTDWINQIQTAGSHTPLTEYTQRQAQLIFQQNGHCLPFALTSPFVTGLGRDHPVENGFAWHHALGVPYLPGSSIKGMIRAWARDWNNEAEARINEILGDQKGVGSVIILDALPTQAVQLKADIMTPHYSPYYSGDATKNPPADWYNPTPIPFLVVSQGSTFQFGIIPRSNAQTNECETVVAWLEQALEWIGAGAKTAVGYGRFQRNHEQEQLTQQALKAKQQEIKQQNELQNQLKNKSPIAQELMQLAHKQDWHNNKNAFTQNRNIESWINKLEQDPHADAIELLVNFVKKHFPGLLENPDATTGKKKKPAFKDNQRAFAKELIKLQNMKSEDS